MPFRQQIDDQVLVALRPSASITWRALGNGEERHGVVVSNYPDQAKLWAECVEFGQGPEDDGLLMVVEYRQVTFCGSLVNSTTSRGD